MHAYLSQRRVHIVEECSVDVVTAHLPEVSLVPAENKGKKWTTCTFRYGSTRLNTQLNSLTQTSSLTPAHSRSKTHSLTHTRTNTHAHKHTCTHTGHTHIHTLTHTHTHTALTHCHTHARTIDKRTKGT